MVWAHTCQQLDLTGSLQSVLWPTCWRCRAVPHPQENVVLAAGLGLSAALLACKSIRQLWLQPQRSQGDMLIAQGCLCMQRQVPAQHLHLLARFLGLQWSICQPALACNFTVCCRHQSTGSRGSSDTYTGRSRHTRGAHLQRPLAGRRGGSCAAWTPTCYTGSRGGARSAGGPPRCGPPRTATP